MDDVEAAIGTLEQALADLGALVVRAGKYVRLQAIATDADRQARKLGADARRLLRRDALGAEEISALLGAGAALQATLRDGLAATLDHPDYRSAVAAWTAGEHDRLAPLIPRIFTAVEAAAAVPHLYLAMPWTRRGRALEPTALAETVCAVAREGLAADGDDLSAGADATLQAVMLDDELPEDEPVVLVLEGARLPVPAFRHVETGTWLLYAPRVPAPFTVELARSLDLDAAPADYPAFRDALAASLRAAGLTVNDAGSDGVDPSR